MSKVKDGSELEYLRGVVRKLKSENRHLKKIVGKQDKQAHLYEDLEEKLKDNSDLREPQLEFLKCPECSASIVTTPLGTVRTITTCTQCRWRRVEKVNGTRFI
jgi:hypothetical protein